MMKKHLSVFGLFARASLVPMLILLLLSAGVQTVLFAAELNYVRIPLLTGESVKGIEELIGDTAIPLTAGISLLLFALLLCVQGTSFSSKTEYTMSRLSVSETSAFLWQSAYNTLAFLIFWAAEAVLMYSLCLWYVSVSANATGQSIFLALFRSEFLHGLLPLHDASRIVRNAVFCLFLGTASAYVPFSSQNGKISIVLIPALTYALGSFRIGDISLSSDIFHILICLFFTGVVIFKVFTSFGFFSDEEEKEDTWNG